MKHILSLLLSLFLLSTPMLRAGNLFLELNNVTIQEALKRISHQANICIIAVSDLSGTVTMTIKNEDVVSTVRKMVSQAGYESSYAEGHLYVGSKDLLLSYDMQRIVASERLNKRDEATVRRELHSKHPYCTVIYDVILDEFVVLRAFEKINSDDINSCPVAMLDTPVNFLVKPPVIATTPPEALPTPTIVKPVSQLPLLKEKLRNLKTRITKNPNDWTNWSKLAVAYGKLAKWYKKNMKMEKYRRALKGRARALYRAIKVQRYDVVLRLKLVHTLLKLGLEDKARKHFSALKKLGPQWKKYVQDWLPGLPLPVIKYRRN